MVAYIYVYEHMHIYKYNYIYLPGRLRRNMQPSTYHVTRNRGLGALWLPEKLLLLKSEAQAPEAMTDMFGNDVATTTGIQSFFPYP